MSNLDHRPGATGNSGPKSADAGDRFDEGFGQSRLIRAHELAQWLGVSRVTIWRWERQKILPAKVKIGPNTVGWKAETIDRWWSQKTGSDDTTKPVDESDPNEAGPRQ